MKKEVLIEAFYKCLTGFELDSMSENISISVLDNRVELHDPGYWQSLDANEQSQPTIRMNGAEYYYLSFLMREGRQRLVLSLSAFYPISTSPTRDGGWTHSRASRLELEKLYELVLELV